MMKTLMAYASKYGCTKRCAEKLAAKLQGQCELFDLKENKVPDLSACDKVIVGSSIYAGNAWKEAKEFCVGNLAALRNKKLGFFICGSQTGAALAQQFDAAYPAELMDKAIVKDCFGGEFHFGKMNFAEKTIVRLIAKTAKDASTVSEEKIDAFAQQMNRA
jgi:menaquinone-dependent protoporphyrinogen oxidase